MNAVSQGDELQNQCKCGEREQWPPEVLQCHLVINMADVAEPKRHASETECYRQECGWDKPADSQRRVKESISWDQFPANLEVDRERP